MHSPPRKVTPALLSALLMSSVLASPLFAQTATPVQVQRLSEVLVELERSAPAEVESLNSATLSAEVAAVVSEVRVEEGQSVKAGDLLLQLDSSDFQLALNQAQANLESSRAQIAQAEARLKRARELSTKQYISADDLLTRETDVRVASAQILVAQAAVDIARRNLEKCAITAPFDGAIIERHAQLGAYVTPGIPLLDLTQTDRFELNAEIPDELAASLLAADSMQFGSRGETWDVSLLRLSPVIDAQRRTRQARFEFAGESPPVGLSGEVVWHAEKGLLPVNLVVRRNGSLGIFLNRESTAVFVPLSNAQEGRPVPITLPLEEDIIVQGRERLQDGDRIAPSRVGG